MTHKETRRARSRSMTGTAKFAVFAGLPGRLIVSAVARLTSWSPLHTVCFDWFLSSLEWILSLEFCLLKLLIFYQKLLCNIRSRLDLSDFEFFGLYLAMFDQNWSFLHKKWRFWSNIFKYMLKNSKCGRV